MDVEKSILKSLERKYKKLFHSNFGKKQQWWFTISPENWIQEVFYLALIHKQLHKIYILEVKPTEDILDIISRENDVHLKGQYDLYFKLDPESKIQILYKKKSGEYITEDFKDHIVEEISMLEIDTISSIEDINYNIVLFESYLDLEYTELERDFALSLIKKGKNFIAYLVGSEYHFIPSRFVGYKNNSIQRHLANENKDGKITSPVISYILNEERKAQPEIDKSFLNYCSILGIKPGNKKRLYWLLNLTESTISSLITTYKYKEGKVRLVKHKKKERSRKLVLDAKKRFRDTHQGQLYCEICNINFKNTYGVEYIEVHHKDALEEIEDEVENTLDDVCLVCPNCDAVFHSEYPCLSFEAVKERYESRKNSQ